MQKVVTTITPGKHGGPVQITVQTEGVSGEACHKLSAPYEQALGGKVISVTPTDEAMQVVATGQASTIEA